MSATMQASTASGLNTAFEEIDRIYQIQKGYKEVVRQTKVGDRKRKLKLLMKTIYEHRGEIQQALYDDFKKPQAETDLTEIYPSVSEIKHTLAHLSEWMAPKSVETPFTFIGSSSKIVVEPKGNTLIISPWNYPFNLVMIPLTAAIAAGNTVMIKPSEYTPHTSALVKRLLSKVFNEQEVAVVEGDHLVSSHLLQLRFDHIFFTGSPAVGKIVMRAAAEHLTSVTLELGGKSPAVIDDSASLSSTAKRLSWGKFLNNGQTCIAPDYALVHESLRDSLVDSIKKQVATFYGDDPKVSNSYARMVNTRHFLRVRRLIEDAVNRGAKVVMGGVSDDQQRYIAPTLLIDVDPESDIMQEEIFGPVLPILTFKTLKEALAIIQSKEKPLAMYIFSRKNEHIEQLIQGTSAGGTCINDTVIHHSHPNLPFGGVNNSGIGKGHGWYGFREFSNERSILRQYNPAPPAQNTYPPYQGLSTQMIDFTLKYL